MIISAAYASEAAGHAAEHAAHHGPFYTQAEFWVGFAFVMVVALAFKPVARAITAGLDARAQQIKGKLSEARKLRDDAQALLAEYQRKQREALQEAEAILAHAKEEADRLRKEAETSLAQSIARREQQAVDRIAQAEAQAMAQVRDIAVDVAMSAAGKMIAANLSLDQQDALIADSIQGLPGKLH